MTLFIILFGALCYAGGVLTGWFGLPAPIFVTNWWKRLFKQKEIEQKH